MNWNLVGSICGRISLKRAHFDKARVIFLLGKSYLYFNRGKDFFRNQPIRNKNCLWLPCLVMDHIKMCTLQRDPSTYASYQVSVHLAEGFQRRRISFCHRLVSVVCHPFTFHILIVSSENPQPNELKLGRKHMWKDLSEECTFWYDIPLMLPTKCRFIWPSGFRGED
jgi:hypothetical protein